MTETWVHWTRGAWLLTSDGLHALQHRARRDRIVLVDARFEFDRDELARGRRLRKPKNHAWAVGVLVEGWSDPPGDVELLDRYDWRSRHYFSIDGVPVTGATWLRGWLDERGSPVVELVEPVRTVLGIFRVGGEPCTIGACECRRFDGQTVPPAPMPPRHEGCYCVCEVTL